MDEQISARVRQVTQPAPAPASTRGSRDRRYGQDSREEQARRIIYGQQPGITLDYATQGELLRHWRAAYAPPALLHSGASYAAGGGEGVALTLADLTSLTALRPFGRLLVVAWRLGPLTCAYAPETLALELLTGRSGSGAVRGADTIQPDHDHDQGKVLITPLTEGEIRVHPYLQRARREALNTAAWVLAGAARHDHAGHAYAMPVQYVAMLGPQGRLIETVHGLSGATERLRAALALVEAGVLPIARVRPPLVTTRRGGDQRW